MSDQTEIIRRLDKENRYLKRKLERIQTQQLRQEKIDEMNRFQAKRANSRLEVARAIAERSNRAKSEFLANMSHEIRTPLNIVLGMAELLDGTELDSAQQQYLRSLRLSGEHLLKLINNILEFSRIESGCIEIEPEPFHITQLLTEVEGIGTHLAVKKDIEFEMTVEEGIGDGRLGDIAKIKQILINLVNNAVKFTAVGKVDLKVCSCNGDHCEGLLFVVSDSGPGIPRDKQDQIFQRFSQVAQDQVEQRSGVGLGLAISQRLAIAMGGSIDFRSKEGQGTTFEVFIPLPYATINTAPKEAFFSVDTIEPEQLPPLNILAVDDVALNLEIICHFLKNSQVTVDCVAHGRDAVRTYSRQKYDLILMDIRMPVMDGRKATKIIRRLEKWRGVERVPIIAMTAHAFSEQRKGFLMAGFDDVMTKPFSRQTLIRNLLGVTQLCPLPKKEIGNRALGSVLEKRSNEDLAQGLVELVPDFLKMISESFETITMAIDTQDYLQLGTICHSVKGVAGMYGFKNLSALVGNIESSASNRNMQSITTLSDSLGYYIKQLKHQNLKSLRN